MTSVRRSLRLSIASKSNTPTTAATVAISRRSEIWCRRQKIDIDSDDEDAKESIGEDCIYSSIYSNNENINLVNKMESKKQSRRTMSSLPSTPKTPRNATRMISRKKREHYQEDNEGTKNSDNEIIQESEEVSPAKQRKHHTLPKHLTSPSRLIGRLSIDDPDSDPNSNPAEEQPELDESKPKATPKRNKYQNARKVLNSGETLKLPGREEQLQELKSFFTEHLKLQKSGSIYVSGQPGTGKTACLSLLLKSPEFLKQFKSVYINCTSISSVGAVFKKLCAELHLKPTGRTERDNQEAIQKHLRTSSKMLLIVLDEIDQLCSSKQSVLYTIFEWPALPKSKLLLVGIANSLDLTDRVLMRLNARCDLKPKLLHFPPYTKQQIVDIFKSRLEEAGVLDIFPPVTLQLLGAKVSAVSGDVRRALDIGRRVVEIAEQQKNSGQKELNFKDLNLDEEKKEEDIKPVQVSQIAAVLNTVYGASQSLQDDIEDSFPLQQKLMLCSLLLILKNEVNKDIIMGRLHDVYRKICNKRNIHPLDQTEFAGLVDLVETRGIIRIIRKKEPRFSKVILQWDEEEVNAALRDKQLIASILDDTSCLGK